VTVTVRWVGLGPVVDQGRRCGFSDLIVDLYRPEVGAHARLAVGMAALPLDNAVVIAAEVAVAD
jgi:hypothetical protein